MSSHVLLVKASMLHLLPEEKKAATQSLMILGLARYASHTQGNTTIDPTTLQRLHGKAILELGDAGKHMANRMKAAGAAGATRHKSPAGRLSNPPNADPFPPAPPSSSQARHLKPALPVRTKHADSSAHPRLDAVSHYPFADSKGSAAALLSSPSPKPSIFTIGAPQRRRLCDRAYAEARRTAAGLRVADIPEVLKGLGIQLPREIERAFLLRSLKATGNDDAQNDKAGGGEGNGGAEAGAGDPTAPNSYGGLVVEPVVSLRQWRCLVERYVDRERRLLEKVQRGQASLNWDQQAEDEDAVVEALLADEGPDLRALLDEEGGWGNAGAAVEDPFLSQSATYPPYHPPSLSRSSDLMDFSPEERELVSRREVEAREAFHAALGRTVLEARARAKTGKKAAPTTITESARFSRQRKEMYGTLGNGAQYGNNGGSSNSSHNIRRPLVVRTTHAHRLRQVQSRIGQEMRMDRRRFQRGQEMGTASALASIAKQRVETLVGGGGGAVNNNPIDGDARGRLADLDTGLATMTIADAFVNSDVGRQIISEQRSDAAAASYSLRSRATAAAVDDDDEVDEAVRAEVQFLLGQDEGPRAGGGGGAQQRESIGQGRVSSSDANKVPYQGWKASKGGMVVDFGPSTKKPSR